MLTAAFAGGSSNKAAPQTAPDAAFFNRPIRGEITVSAYDSMLYKNYLEEAARAFEALYPGTKVNVETFSAMPEIRTGGQTNMQLTTVQAQDDSQGRADYLSRVNTNIMSGTGADIYAMDVIPLHKFVESGTLENLDPYMNLDPRFNRADYRQNILDALRYSSSKGTSGTWFLPMDYTFNYFAYDSTLIPAQIAARFGVDKSFCSDDLLKIGIPLYDGSYKLFNTLDYIRGPGGMFNQLLNESLESYVNLQTGRPGFTDGRFANLLASVSNYAERGYIPRGITGQQNAGQIMQRGMQTPTDRYFFKLNGNVSLLGQFTRGAGTMMRMMTGGTSAAVDENDEIAGIQANADGKIPFDFNQGFGINSRSKNRETAWAFIKFLLSREMQLSTHIMSFGLPLNNEARAEKAALSFAGLSPNLNEQLRQNLDRYKAAVEKLSDSINAYIVKDTSISDMIAQEVQYYFSGSRTANEVARVLQNKADLYLGE